MPGHRLGGIVAGFRGVDSEVGQLRSVIVHRPGPELKRITPRNRGGLPFDRVPWVDRAQQEHDAFTQALREHGVDVLFLTELLQDVLEYGQARHQVLAAVLDDARLGDELRGQVQRHLDGLDPESLSHVLIAGLAQGEFRGGRGAVYQLLGPHDFVVEPLPSLVFARDSSVWVGDGVAVTSPVPPGRRREASLLQAIYAHHPRFTGAAPLYGPGPEELDGGDLVLLAPGVIAVGTGGRTTAAAVERLARNVFAAGVIRTVLAVPVGPGAAAVHRGPAHLDTICTLVDVGTAVMHPALAYSLTARIITPSADGLRVSHPRPFLEAAALAMGIGRLRMIGTGLDPADADRGQWDDGGNTLAIGPRQVVSFERNVETNARLEAAGIDVIRVPGSELSSDRGGPRCLTCPIGRDPVSAAQSCSPADRMTVGFGRGTQYLEPVSR